MNGLLCGLMALIVWLYPSNVRAAFRYDELWLSDTPLLVDVADPLTGLPESVYDQVLVANGVDPRSHKGRLVREWIVRLNSDLKTAANARRDIAMPMNSHARAELIADGLKRLSPALRLQYVELISKFLDTLVPPDCFGSNDISVVIDRIPLSAISESDINAYFNLVRAALHASQAGIDAQNSSPEEYAQADEGMRRSLLHELDYVQSNVTRYSAYAQNPKVAAPVDACWAMRVTMHAMLRLSNPERDVVLRRALQP